MKRIEKHGFSLLELIAAVVILAVVSAAMVATVTPIRARSNDKLAEQELVTLNQLAKTYFEQTGQYPQSVSALVEADLLSIQSSQDQLRFQRIQREFDYEPSSGRFTSR